MQINCYFLCLAQLAQIESFRELLKNNVLFNYRIKENKLVSTY